MNTEQALQLRRCREAVGPCIEGRYELLTDFLSRLGYSDGEAVRRDAHLFLPRISEWMDQQTLTPDDFGFIFLRLMVFIGELVAQRYDGAWTLDDDPASPHFATYVIKNFKRIKTPAVVVDPGALAQPYLNELSSRGPMPLTSSGPAVYVTGDGGVSGHLVRLMLEVESDLNRLT